MEKERKYIPEKIMRFCKVGVRRYYQCMCNYNNHMFNRYMYIYVSSPYILIGNFFKLTRNILGTLSLVPQRLNQSHTHFKLKCGALCRLSIHVRSNDLRNSSRTLFILFLLILSTILHKFFKLSVSLYLLLT